MFNLKSKKMEKKFTKLGMMFIVVTMGILMISCGSSKNTATTVSVTDQKEMSKQLGMQAEVEVTFPCSGVDSDDEFLRVNGNGSSKDRTMAKERAYQNALSNLSTKLAGVASSGNTRVAVSVNADGEEFHDKMVAVSKVIAKANVSGYRTSCEKYTMNPSNGSYICYVTIDFGKQKVVRELYENLSDQKLLKVDYDFSRYLEMFDKDLEEYEKANK